MHESTKEAAMSALSRRTILRAGVGSALALAVAPLLAPRARATSALPGLVAESPFAGIMEIGDGLFAVISTPLDGDGRFAHPQSLCNGGLIVGDDRILAVDAYYTPEGAAWVDEQAMRLFGRRVSDVICTHLHLDHTGGLAGFQNGAEGPEIYMTATTWALMVRQYSVGRPVEGTPFTAPPARLVGPTRVIENETAPVSLDLGGRSVTVLPLAGHTPSDLAILVDDAPVTYGGDLAWWGLFPNYMDAVPSALGPSVERLMADGPRLMVPGHGSLITTDRMAPYVELIDSVEAAAVAAREGGLTAAEAASDYRPPAATADWKFFDPRYPETAIAAWFREWDREAVASAGRGDDTAASV
jgi:glyoxylase-like metal-dependent hydrolase (beta-lactamase superfamily II)